MATFFGEVLPVISRAVDDEEDDANLDKYQIPSVHLVVTPPNDVNLKVNNFVVGVGPVAAGFLNAYCLNTDDVENIGYVEEKEDTSTITEKRKEEKICSIYVGKKRNSRTAYCLTTSSYLDPEKLWYYVEQLFQLPFCDELTELVILDSSLIHNYLSHETEINLPVVKSIWNNFYKKKHAFSSLSQPNTVNGFSSAVLTKCELMKIPAVLHVCYTDSLSLSLSAINSFTTILHEEPFHYDKEMKSFIQDRIKSLVSSHGSQHSLYV